MPQICVSASNRHCAPALFLPLRCAAERVPAAISWLGIHNETAGSVWNLHNPKFLMDEEQLPLGAALHASVALVYLRRAAAAGGRAGAAGGAGTGPGGARHGAEL